MINGNHDDSEPFLVHRSSAAYSPRDITSSAEHHSHFPTLSVGHSLPLNSEHPLHPQLSPLGNHSLLPAAIDGSDIAIIGSRKPRPAVDIQRQRQRIRTIASYCPNAVSLPVLLGKIRHGQDRFAIGTALISEIESGHRRGSASSSSQPHGDESPRSPPNVGQTGSSVAGTKATSAAVSVSGGVHAAVPSAVTAAAAVSTRTRREFFGVVLLADISGFTKLTESLATGHTCTDAYDSSHTTCSSTAVELEKERDRANAYAREPFLQRTQSSVNQMQREGADTIANIINAIFGKLIAVVRLFGGDVVKFAGDALIALWRPNGDSLEEQVYVSCELSSV